jgi:hypothetical protein
MGRVTLSEVAAWVDPAKIPLTALDQELLSHLEEEVLVQLVPQYNVSTWLSPETTPKIVRVIIAKTYASFYIDRAYAENQDVGNDYAARLMANANMLITGLVGGSIQIPEIPPDNPSSASFYPNDASSAQTPTSDDPSLGGPWFSLGRVF